MDEVLTLCDELALDKLYPASMPRDDPVRQMVSLLGIVTTGGIVLYLLTATVSYYLIFDHNLMKHKRFLKNQVRLEIQTALYNIPFMSLMTCPLFLLEVRGYSRLYDKVEDYGWPYFLFSIALFLMFIDFGIYWIHRGLHLPFFYRNFHKPHHKWLVPTPFASHAFHWLDGFAQSSPYHMFVFLFPLHKWLYIGLFVFVNVWTVSIHDGEDMVPDWAQDYINGAGHHTDHHLYFNFNYGQFFTLWDRIGGSHRNPVSAKLGVMDKDLTDQDTPDCEKEELNSAFKDLNLHPSNIEALKKEE